MEKRFGFGQNWKEFSIGLSERSLVSSEAGLRALLAPIDIKGKSFLDIGSGSGLSSLSAWRMGARPVYSFDYDIDSVECTRAVKDRFSQNSNEWQVERGDVLDPGYMNRIHQFDVVYSWGVLHHTGQMWQAIENAAAKVAPGGIFAIAIYNDQGVLSQMWHWVKRNYVRSPGWMKPLWIAFFLPYFAFRKALVLMFKKQTEFVRGMSFYYDLVDWVGGFPFEVASRDQLVERVSALGFQLHRIVSVGSRLGCNQFVFIRKNH